MSKWITWSHEWGEKYESGFYDKLLSEGKISPQNIKPEIEPFIFYVDAFAELNTCRPLGEGPIPFTSIAEYFKIYGEGEDFDEFIYIIRSMDSTFLKVNSKKRTSPNGSGTTNTKNSNTGRRSRR